MRKSVIIALVLLGISYLLLSSCAQSVEITVERRALLIGISDYPDSYNDLTYPAIDAGELRGELTGQGWDTNLVLDAAATREGIRAEMETTFAGMSPDGIALIYYSGHGTVSSYNAAHYQYYYGTLSGYAGDIGDSLLVPYDFDYRKEIWAGGISPDDLYSWIEEYIATDNVIVIADSCFSGGFVASSDSDDAIAVEFAADPWNTSSVLSLAAMDNFAELLSKNARESENLSPIMISAAGSEEPSYEDYATTDPRYLGYRNGIFTYYLLKSIAGGDSNGDGFVTCTEAYTYSARALDKHWNRQFPSVAFYPHISGGLRDLVLFEAE